MVRFLYPVRKSYDLLRLETRISGRKMEKQVFMGLRKRELLSRKQNRLSGILDFLSSRTSFTLEILLGEGILFTSLLLF